MALKIRLARGGSKKRPYYHVVVADARSPRDGRFLEKVGSWNPMLAKDDAKRIELDADRIKHWLDNGAQPTDRVLRFLDEAGVAKREAKSNPEKAKPGKKAQNAPLKRHRRLLTPPLLLNNWPQRLFETGGMATCRPFFVPICERSSYERTQSILWQSAQDHDET